MTCPHLHRRIESPNGSPLLKAECQRCGHVKMLPASEDMGAAWYTRADDAESVARNEKEAP
jgi:hypothetical protein